jgi:hypothetical protein
MPAQQARLLPAAQCRWRFAPFWKPVSLPHEPVPPQKLNQWRHFAPWLDPLEHGLRQLGLRKVTVWSPQARAGRFRSRNHAAQYLSAAAYERRVFADSPIDPSDRRAGNRVLNDGFLRSHSSSFTTSPNALGSVFRQSARSEGLWPRRFRQPLALSVEFSPRVSAPGYCRFLRGWPATARVFACYRFLPPKT